MKQKITILRMAGTICLLAFIIMKLVNIFPTVATALLILSVICFAVIVLLQVYHHYINRYNRAGEKKND